MLFAIPILVEEQAGGDGLKSFSVRPLFHDGPVRRAEKLTRALNELASDLQAVLKGLGRDPRHDALAEWTSHPALEETTLTLRLELRSGSHKCEVFLAGYPALDRHLWFTPLLPEVHFEVLPGQQLAERATAVLTQHFRQQEKAGHFEPERLNSAGKVCLTTLELELEPAAMVKPSKAPGRALLFGSLEKKDGEAELRKTGRPLHALYPDDLERAVGREAEVAELARLLAGKDRRPVVLVGPRQVGKSAILHELAWRIGARKAERYAGGRQIWLISPGRLISGMSYLGEWENRVLAILTYARAQDRVLYFDDLPGLFTAGVTAASDLNVAQVLKPHLEQRQVRVVAEITPEAWRVLRERDRRFAELFHVIPVTEMTETETLRVLVSVARQLEESHRCEFALATPPAVFDLLRRFGGDAAFPGKAAGFLRRLAARCRGEKITADTAIREFHAQTGLDAAFLNQGTELNRREILAKLRQEVMGQDQALEAFADVLVKFKARLNDPRRPLGTLLLLGPTGVGKTQAATALAKLLFGTAERLLRFDLNEYVEPAAAARLTGTPGEPEGLLTSAIRRQPFSVVLFDEIEKAAPEVFDLLLAVLDEGRLTDALGRVADFTQAIIVLTSNLGAREVRSRLGFGADANDSGEVFVSAAEKFFRPEFFNRLDRVIPFRSLTPEHLAGIAQRLVAEVCQREGLRRRDCLVRVQPAALQELVTLGHHPQMGARALKRVVERELAQPLARRLAGTPPGTASLAVLSAAAGRFELRVDAIPAAPRTVTWRDQLELPRSEREEQAWTEKVLEQAAAFLRRTDKLLRSIAPSGPLRLGELAPEHTRYTLGREQWRLAAGLIAASAPDADSLRGGWPVHSLRPRAGGKPRSWRADPQRDQLEAHGILTGELESLEEARGEFSEAPLPALLREVAWLEVLLAPPADQRPFGLRLRGLVASDALTLDSLLRLHRVAIASLQGTVEVPGRRIANELLPPVISLPEPPGTAAIWCEGWNLRRVLPAGETCMRVRHHDGSLGFILISRLDAESPDELRAKLGQPADSDRLAPATHHLESHLGTLEVVTDLRSGLTLRGEAEIFARARDFLLAALPLPPEFVM